MVRAVKFTDRAILLTFAAAIPLVLILLVLLALFNRILPPGW